MGRDVAVSSLRDGFQGVSIHAPAWGATGPFIDFLWCFLFQSTRPHGARLILMVTHHSHHCGFQSTRPHGARPRQQRKRPQHRSFNPRARMGRDPKLLRYHPAHTLVSIHAPAWGATHKDSRSTRTTEMFQSTRPHGARRSWSASIPNLVTFQSTRPHGARLAR